MGFELRSTNILEVKLLIPTRYNDDRGYFLETFKQSEFEKFGIMKKFNQDNQSFSLKGTLRGMHFQNPPFAQTKLVRCVQGKIVDIAVDIRKNSPTFGKYVKAELSSENMNMLWIPEGFAHGFIALEHSMVLYKATSEYNRDSESGLIWNDHRVGIDWPRINISLSEKDKKWPGIDNVMSDFEYGVNS